MPPRTQRRPSHAFGFLVVALATSSGPWTLLAVADAPGSSRLPPPPLRGQAALDALGAQLSEVAAAYDLSPARLRELFARDRTLHLATDSQLLYVDPQPAGEVMAEAPASSGALASPESTFVLHSRPGAAHTIYLDFDGHVTQGTRWNTQYGMATIVSPPFDLDGNPSSFSNAERILIQQAWEGVAEDFRPFDVNVTTQDPGVEALRRAGAGDAAWGIRVVFTADFTGGSCQCAGMAFLGYFSASTDTPVFVFNRTALADLVDTASHEVGHSLRLHHDGGVGQEYYAGHGVPDGTSWGPLMGGTYQRLVTQWSKGEYSGATNSEDDLAIITTMNGFGYRPDDHADDAAGATALTVADRGDGRLEASGSGIIGGPSADVDRFTFVCGAGKVDLTLRSHPPSTRSYPVHRPNLNVDARLYDSGGTLLAASQGVHGVSISAAVPGGRYSLAVSGTGVGLPWIPPPSGYSPYGSLGSYDVSGTIPGSPCPAVLSMSPKSGPPGTPITIRGTDLAWVRTVRFTGGIAAAFTLEDPTRITVPIPAGAASGPLTLSSDPYCGSLSTKPVTICPGSAQAAPPGEGEAEAETCVEVVAVEEPGVPDPALRIAPNPMVHESTIRFELPRAGVCRVRILDPAGRLVRRLQGGWTPAGPQQLRWDGRDRTGTRVDSGIYFVAVDRPGGMRERGKLVILR